MGIIDKKQRQQIKDAAKEISNLLRGFIKGCEKWVEHLEEIGTKSENEEEALKLLVHEVDENFKREPKKKKAAQFFLRNLIAETEKYVSEEERRGKEREYGYTM